MAPYLDEGSMKSNKPKGLSFFASIFSLFISIYILYILNLSPYTIFNNTIFWFFMSNTLILIIAADYGAFSSSKDHKQDIYLYEEYVKHGRARNHVPSSYVLKYKQVDGKRFDIKQAEPGGGELLEENNKNTTVSKSQTPERGLEIVVNDPKKPSDHESVNETKPAIPLQMGHSEEKPIPGQRCKSYRHDSRKRAVIDESKNVVWRSESVKQEERVEEENEFSSMTNEELNRRVEEFIQRLHRQMRLRAARNMHQI